MLHACMGHHLLSLDVPCFIFVGYLPCKKLLNNKKVTAGWKFNYAKLIFSANFQMLFWTTYDYFSHIFL